MRLFRIDVVKTQKKDNKTQRDLLCENSGNLFLRMRMCTYAKTQLHEGLRYIHLSTICQQDNSIKICKNSCENHISSSTSSKVMTSGARIVVISSALPSLYFDIRTYYVQVHEALHKTSSPDPSIITNIGHHQMKCWRYRKDFCYVYPFLRSCSISITSFLRSPRLWMPTSSRRSSLPSCKSNGPSILFSANVEAYLASPCSANHCIVSPTDHFSGLPVLNQVQNVCQYNISFGMTTKLPSKLILCHNLASICTIFDRYLYELGQVYV